MSNFIGRNGTDSWQLEIRRGEKVVTKFKLNVKKALCDANKTDV